MKNSWNPRKPGGLFDRYSFYYSRFIDKYIIPLDDDQLISFNAKLSITLPLSPTLRKLKKYEWRSVDALLELENILLSVLCTELDEVREKLQPIKPFWMFFLIYFRTLIEYSLTVAR